MTAPAMLSFTFEGTQLRGFEEEEESWFVAQDACALLGLGNPSQALAKLDDDEKGIITSDTLGGHQQLLIVSESGLYALIFRSRKPVAKLIRKWVTQEVLPTIRKTGRYELPANDDEQTIGPVGSDPLGLDSRFDIERLNVKVALLREYRHIFGKDTAQRMVEPLGLPVPQWMQTAAGRFSIDDLDRTIVDWIEERCTLEPSYRTMSRVLFKDYEEWCELHDRSPCNQTKFGKQLERAGVRGFHSNGMWRRGIRLKD